jgi:HTH-type transcriptional regulator/antitoxin HigA
MTKRIPAESFPPGEYLKDELDARGWSQSDFAEIIGRNPKTVSMIMSGRTRITEETAQLLEAALEIDSQYWLNLETAYRLAQSRDLCIPNGVARRARLYEKFPVSQMARRGWVEPTENLDVLQHRLFAFFRISRMDQEPTLAHAAKKTAEPKKTPIQLAWLFRTHELASAMTTAGFTKGKLNMALRQLRQLLKEREEIRHIPRILENAGIRFVVVEAIPGSKIDGACYWLNNNSPVVALSLRYNRIDNFWFVLMHELRHIANNHGKLHGILDTNLFEQESQLSKEDEKVNKEASEFLVPSNDLDDFVARVRPIFSRVSVVGFANRMAVHPGIVVGQLHHREAIPHSYHTKLIVKVKDVVCSTALCDGWGTTPTMRS